MPASSSGAVSNSGCWPGAWPGSGSPNAARASAIAVRMRSRRVVFAVSRVVASASAASGVCASSRFAASSASPTRPAALSRGARTNPTVSRSTVSGATCARARSAAIPGRAAVRIRASPSRAIERFSPRIGTTSDTVPMVARSASSSASASDPRRSANRSRATVNATPLPDNPGSG